MRKHSVLLAFFLAVAQFMVSGSAYGAVGRTSAEFSVSPQGAAQYTVPLWTPPGVGQLKPDLALTYDNATGNGLLGVGWRIKGLSAITRCAKTWAQDGVPGAIDTGRFCLDGNQLRLTSGTYGAAGSTYQTEIDTFSRVTLYASGAFVPGYFIVEYKNGLIAEYGNTTDSRIDWNAPSAGFTATWAINKLRDRAGNAITYAYAEDTTNRTYKVSEINYPYTSTGQGPFYRVKFVYETRPTADTLVSRAVHLGPSIETNRLDRIDVQSYSAGWNLVRRYDLTYGSPGPSNRSRITQIQECGPTDCLSPTVIGYQDGTAGLGSEVAAGSALLDLSASLDMNGDGFSDLVTRFGGSGNYTVRLGGVSGYGTPIDTGISPSGNWPLVIDYNSDGRMDILDSWGSNWRILQSTGTGFTVINTTIPSVGSGYAWIGDIDGDGREDLLYKSPTNNTQLLARFNTGSGFSATPTVVFTTPTSSQFSAAGPFPLVSSRIFDSFVQMADFNADGKSDVLIRIVITSGTLQFPAWLVLYWNGTSFTSSYSLNGAAYSGIAMLGDFNADGYADVMFAVGPTWYVAYGYYGGTTAAVSTGIPIPGTYDSFKAMDWDGDGRTDLLLGSGRTASAAGVYYLYRSNGNGFDAGINTGIPDSTALDQVQVTDINGDGLGDWTYMSTGSTIKYRLHAGVMPDMATAFTDGFGINYSPSYTPISQGAYSKYTDSVFPGYDFQGPMYVVNNFSASNGIGGTYSQSFWYWGARMDLQGRGFLGFQARRTLDTRNNLFIYEYARRDFPYIGMPDRTDVFQSDATTLISRTQYTYSVQTAGSGYQSRTFTYASAITTDQYEAGGSSNGAWISRKAESRTVDTYGNLTGLTVTTQDKDSISPWVGETFTSQVSDSITNDTTYWCLGQSTQTTIASTLPSGVSQTRTTGRTIDYVNCRVAQEVKEPASSTLGVTTNYTYDPSGCGNPTQVQVIGQNPNGTAMPARTTTIGYGSRCQFPETTTNPLAETSTAGYRYDLGVQISQTDANNVSVVWTYDDYGRKTLETRPDGTKTRWTLYSCNAGNSYCGVPDLRWYIDESVLATTGSVLTYTYRFFDAFDRYRIDEPLNLAGGLDYKKVEYDALGRKSRDYAPYDGGWGYHEYTYDMLNRVTTDTLYKNGGIFDRQTSAGYQGRKATHTDALANITTKYFDVRGKLRRIDDPFPGGITYFNWDPFGNLKSTVDSIGAVSASSYNIRGFKYETDDADAGVWNYSVNSLGEVLSQTDAKGQTTTFVYDKLSRLTSRVESEGTSTWIWGQISDNDIDHKYVGRLKSASSPGGYSEVYVYDAKGRLQATTYNADAAYEIAYDYNASTGFLDSVVYPTSTSGYRLRAQYLYQNGILNQIRDYHSPSTVWWQLNAQDARGNPMDEVFGNGVHVISQNDGLTGHLNWRTSGTNAQYDNHQNLAYEWDKNENLKKRKDVIQSNLTEEFFYDALNRIDYSTLNSTTNLDVTLDSAGNIVNKSDVGSFNYTTPQSGCSYYTHTQPHAVRSVGGVPYCYDANGNMVKRNSVTTSFYSYNLPNTISNGTYSSAFYYTPDRKRWKQVASYTGGNETTLYIGNLMEKVTVSTGTAYRHYIPAGSTMVLHERWTTGDNPTYYMTTDHLSGANTITCGSGVSGCTSGNVLVKESFAAYGSRRGSNWTGSPTSGDLANIGNTTRRGFTGQEHLDNLGLIHMNGRMYDPLIGRFLSVDPFRDLRLGSQGLNRYAYVGNNPLTFTDPSGFQMIVPGDRIHDDNNNNNDVPGLDGVLGANLTAGWDTSLQQMLLDAMFIDGKTSNLCFRNSNRCMGLNITSANVKQSVGAIVQFMKNNGIAHDVADAWAGLHEGDDLESLMASLGKATETVEEFGNSTGGPDSVQKAVDAEEDRKYAEALAADDRAKGNWNSYYDHLDMAARALRRYYQAQGISVDTSLPPNPRVAEPSDIPDIPMYVPKIDVPMPKLDIHLP